MEYHKTLKLIKRLKAMPSLDGDQTTLLNELEAEADAHRARHRVDVAARRQKFSDDRKASIAKRDVQNHTTKRHALKLRAIEYKGGACAHCKGVFHPAVFEFHHIDIENKEFTVSNASYGNWEKVAAELDKCVMLCANCHRIVHNTIVVPTPPD